MKLETKPVYTVMGTIKGAVEPGMNILYNNSLKAIYAIELQVCIYFCLSGEKKNERKIK
jgi:hypothetical protein